jgi:alcohol dehydrogenase class IV
MTRSATKISYGTTGFDTGGRSIKYVAIPTTLSAGEFSYGAATTDDQGKKGSIIDPRIGPVFTVLDSELASVTPDQLWLTSGVKCLDHAVEALYSAHRNAFSDALASGALRLLLGNLQGSVSVEHDERIARRGHCLMAALLSNYAAMDTRYGLSHVVGHKCGPRWHIPHGVTSCIALPPSMRFMGKVAPERFDLLADTLGIDRGLDASMRAIACADRIGDFIAGLGVPTRLRDYDVKESELNDIVQMVLDQVTLSGTIGRPVTAAEMGEVIRDCW